MSGPRGIHLSGSQVIASVLATLTGAIAASYLGVAGTLIGAALGSIASTMGTEVYRHYLLRSQEGLKSAGEMLYHRTTGAHTVAQHPATGHTAAQPGEASRGNGATQDSGTRLIPELTALRRNGQTIRWAGNGGGDRDSLAGPGATASTRAAGQVGDGAAGSGTPVASPGAGGGDHWWDRISRRQWLAYGGLTAGAFAVVIVVLTIFELSVGKPVNAVVWGKHGSGTSLGNVVSGHSSPHQAHPAGTVTPTATPSGSVPGSPAGSPSLSATPTTSAPVTPAPTPTTPGASSPAGIHSQLPSSPTP